MKKYRRGAHTVFEIHLHIVWSTKYRHNVLGGLVGHRLRELIRAHCVHLDVTSMQGYGAVDHVHVFVSIPPDVTIRRLVQQLKGRSSYMLLREFPHLHKRFWGRHLWARGYFCCRSGNVTDDSIRQYIAQHSDDSDDEFRVVGDAL
ncbi:MAG: IS200/IS605 family transposase [Herpetosiphon sp.]|nr:IS200/IS605 family transposase [Herpetosiphon sp.]